MDEREMNSRGVDETLRMIARMPAPEGLAERINTGLQLAERPGRLLRWPTIRSAKSLGTSNASARTDLFRTGWVRGAAAAAIALVIAGGGWGIYARVSPAQSAKTVALPQAQPSGKFSEAGAMRRPLTLAGPKALQPVLPPNGKSVIHSQVSNGSPGAPGVGQGSSDPARAHVKTSASEVTAPAQ